MRLWPVLVAVMVLVALGACSSYRDVLIPNPCAQMLEVQILSPGEQKQGNDDPPIKIGPHQSKALQDVVPDVGARFVARVTNATGRTTNLEIPPDGPDPYVLVVPAEAC